MNRYPYTKDPQSFVFHRKNELEKMIGKIAVVIKKLAPIGLILVDGFPRDAISKDMVIPVGTKVEIIGVDMNELIVSLFINQI